MPTEEPNRKFNPSSVLGLSTEARKAVNAALDAMSTWRIETVNASERGIEQVIEKMAAAARALGWPEQIVDATRAQLQSITKMQIQLMDQMMDAWEEPIKSRNPMTSSPTASMLSRLKSLPGVSSAGVGPNANAWLAGLGPKRHCVCPGFLPMLCPLPVERRQIRLLGRRRCRRSVRCHASDPMTVRVRAAPPETYRSLKPAPTSARS
jgi:hypothetical protein